MKAIIIEDNQSDSWNFEMILEKLDIKVQGVYKSWTKVLSEIKKDLPDFIIVDFYLDKGEKGIDFLEAMRDSFVPTILCTAYPEQVNIDSALHYGVKAVISKPINKTSLTFQIKKLVKEIKAKKSKENYLIIREKSNRVKVPIDSIYKIEIQGNYSFIFLESNKRYVQKLSLIKLMEQLDSDKFIRCHRSTIVNLNHVTSIDTQTNIISMSNGTSLTIGRRFRPSILSGFTEM